MTLSYTCEFFWADDGVSLTDECTPQMNADEAFTVTVVALGRLNRGIYTDFLQEFPTRRSLLPTAQAAEFTVLDLRKRQPSLSEWVRKDVLCVVGERLVDYKLTLREVIAPGARAYPLTVVFDMDDLDEFWATGRLGAV